MATQAASQRPLSAVEEAMMGDLGAARIEALPMDDGRFSHQHATLPRDLPRPKEGPPNKWRTAIADGAFDDDDAMQVANLESIADGQLARIHRAGRIAGMIVAASYDDQHLRRGSNGQIDPRARFYRGQRGPFIAGRAHQGDGPVQIPGMLSYSRHKPAPTGSNRRPGSISASPGPHATRSSQPSRARPATQPRVPARPAVVQTQTPSPQKQRQRRPVDNHLVLPDGASIVFQMPVELASPTFIDRHAMFPGIVYLIAGRGPADDQIMLRVEEEGIDDVKHSAKEYSNLMSKSQEIILQFNTATGRTTWYVVGFSKRDDMITFVDALRDFVDHPNQTLRTSSTVAATDQGLVSTNNLAAVSETSRDTVTDEAAVSSSTANELLPVQSTEPPKPIQPHAAQTGIASVQQQDTDLMLPATLIEEIVSWVINIVAFIREFGPAELARFDALPGVIRGAATAVLLSRHPDFATLDKQQRVAYIDERCAPRVFEIFKCRLREQATQKLPVQTVQTTAPQDQAPRTIRAPTPPKPHRFVYTGEELLRLRSKAESPPPWLTELSFPIEATRSTHQDSKKPGLEWDEDHDAPMPNYKNQIQQVAANAEWLYGGRGPESLHSSSSTRDELIGLFVSNSTSDAEVRELIAEEDQDKIVRILPWGHSNKVVRFKTIEDRDGALLRIADVFKTRSQKGRLSPRVEIFQRLERGRTYSNIRGAPGTSRSSDGHQSHPSLKGHSTQTSQSSVSKTVIATRDADSDTVMAMGDYRVKNPPKTHGLDGHSTPARDLISIDSNAGPTWDQLTSNLPPRAPAIAVTAPTERGSAAGASRVGGTLASLSDIMKCDSEQPSSASDGQSGLNASRFNPDNADLLGENSGSWTGALAKNKSYMQDLMDILWTDDVDIACTEDPEIAKTVDLFAAKRLN